MNHRIKNNNSKKRAVKRERIIMIVSSAFVMAALTMTGIYMKEKTVEEENDGYTVDLAGLENNVADKYAELAEGIDNQTVLPQVSTDLSEEVTLAEDSVSGTQVAEIELDYMPLEEGDSLAAVDSGQIEIAQNVEIEIPEIMEFEEPTSIMSQLSFSEEEGLIAPVSGEILMHYNMDSTVYFQTLDQYKYNPAVIFAAQEGSDVVACADGQVVKIYQNEEIGTAIVLDLGDGYQVTYGQLASYNVSLGDYVAANQVFATVAYPTKYYVTEGCNLYFAMEKDGEVMNPETLLPD